MGEQPCYSIFFYRDDFYKVVHFKSTGVGGICIKEKESNDSKLNNNIARARSMVLQYGICNDWDYFFTGTLDKRKFNRYSLDAFALDFPQWIRNQRKKYNLPFRYLFIPERHKKGGWHIHGMCSGFPDSEFGDFPPNAPLDLREGFKEGKYFNWEPMMQRYGYCSFAPIRNSLAASFYILKYIGKDMQGRSSDLGQHLYFHSHGLKKAQKVADILYYDEQLSSICTSEFEFCSTGFVSDVDWSFPYRFDGCQPVFKEMTPTVKNREEVLKDVDLTQFEPAYYQQMRLDGFQPLAFDL